MARVWIFVSRVQCYPEGEVDLEIGGKITFAWYVFRHGHQGPPALGWITDKTDLHYDRRVGVAEAIKALPENKRTKFFRGGGGQ